MVASSVVAKLVCGSVLLVGAHRVVGQPGGGEGDAPVPSPAPASASASTTIGSTSSDSASPTGSVAVDFSTSDTDGSKVCDSSGAAANYAEVLSGTDSMMTRNTSTTTGCPNHINWPMTPNDAVETPYSSIIPAYPMLMDANDSTDLSEATFPTGMMLNGVALYSSWGRVKVDSYETTAFVIEGSTLDLCAGHGNPEGVYHYHCTPGCLQEHAMLETGATEIDHSPQLGWSYDGFPVYGQLGPNGTEMKMCGEDGAHELHCLDWCSGYEAEVEADDFNYRYYLSCGANESFFPFTTNCYRGCCPQGMECGGSHVETCGDAVVEGYTDAYVPATGTPLTEPYDTNFLEGNDTQFVNTTSPLNCSLYIGSWGKEGLNTAASSTAAPTSTPTPISSPPPQANTSQAPVATPTGITSPPPVMSSTSPVSTSSSSVSSNPSPSPSSAASTSSSESSFPPTTGPTSESSAGVSFRQYTGSAGLIVSALTVMVGLVDVWTSTLYE